MRQAFITVVEAKDTADNTIVPRLSRMYSMFVLCMYVNEQSAPTYLKNCSLGWLSIGLIMRRHGLTLGWFEVDFA